MTSIALCALWFFQSPNFDQLKALFDYDRSKPAEAKLTPIDERGGGVKIFDFSFNSPVAGRVSGFLVVPPGAGRHPVILYGHWMMEGSSVRNKYEFLEEAVIMGRIGGMGVLLDAPLVRPDNPVEKDPDLAGPRAQMQMVKEWRRALDIVLARPDADGTRVAYVGHSFNAGTGAKLAGVEKRIGSFVLMANQYSLREFLFDEQNAAMVAQRKKEGDAAVEIYLQKSPWHDSRPFAEHSAPASVFLQYGRNDKPLPESAARLSFARFAYPKRMEFYDAGHELNAAARLDRAFWLQKQLRLTKAPDSAALNAIAPLK